MLSLYGDGETAGPANVLLLDPEHVIITMERCDVEKLGFGIFKLYPGNPTQRKYSNALSGDALATFELPEITWYEIE